MTRHLLMILVMTGFVCASASSILAAGDGDGTASPAPRPVQEKKIYMNEDVDALASRYGGSVPAKASVPQSPARSVSPSQEQRPTAGAMPGTIELENMTHEKDPRWYVKQMVSLEAELEETDAKAQQLREFRATGTGFPVGLVLSAPCEGITTDNEIEQLGLRRQEIVKQIDELDDTARRNGFPPGFLRAVPELAQAFEGSVPMTPKQERAVLTEQLQRNSKELAVVRGVIAGMKSATGTRGMTLLPYAPEYGGSPTADFLQRLDARANVLENQISTVQDEARQAGIVPSSLP